MYQLKADVVKTTKRYGRPIDPFWFQKREDDLKDVTSEASNPAVGVENIAILPIEITENMRKANIVAKVNVDTTAGYVNGVTIFFDPESRSIYLSTQKRTYTVQKNGQEEERSSRDFRFKRAAEAQILSYIWSLLVPVEEEEAVNDLNVE